MQTDGHAKNYLQRSLYADVAQQNYLLSCIRPSFTYQNLANVGFCSKFAPDMLFLPCDDFIVFHVHHSQRIITGRHFLTERNALA